MRTLDNPFQQNSVTYCLELQIKFIYLQYFVQFCDGLSDSIVYFEAEETKNIDSNPEDLWQIEVYLDDKPDLEDLQKQINELALNHSIAAPTLHISKVKDHDWVSEVQKSFIPIQAERFFIHHSGYKDEIPSDKIAIEIDAGRAFGTGEHETTSNCLKALSELADDNNRYTNCLDMGCGSGILAIATAKLWPNQITAVDIDEQAVLVTRENIDLNKVGFIIASQSNGYDSNLVASNGKYQLITANILAAPLIEMAAAAYQHLAKNGILILAGFLKKQRQDVLEAHQQQGLILVKEICAENWPVLVMKK